MIFRPKPWDPLAQVDIKCRRGRCPECFPTPLPHQRYHRSAREPPRAASTRLRRSPDKAGRFVSPPRRPRCGFVHEINAPSPPASNEHAETEHAARAGCTVSVRRDRHRVVRTTSGPRQGPQYALARLGLIVRACRAASNAPHSRPSATVRVRARTLPRHRFRICRAALRTRVSHRTQRVRKR